LLEFPSVVDAVECAIAIQTPILEPNAETRETKRIVYRVGADPSDVLIEGEDIQGERGALIYLVEHRRAEFSPNLDDHIGWYVHATRRSADRIWVRRFIEAIGLPLVRAEKGKYPRHALLVVDLFDIVGVLLRHADLFGEVPLMR